MLEEFSISARTGRMDLWFEEKADIASGCSLRIPIKRTIEKIRSKYQEIALLETENFGRMLVLDGIIMLTEFDEFAYHEMIVHVPLNTHMSPRRVLVVGGGDGGTVREILKHEGVEEVHLCEIDKMVVDICMKHLPSLASGFDDSRVHIFYEDGAQFVKAHKAEYDVIIVDSSDPVGPATVLFQEEFYRDIHGALKDDGIVVSQCESIFFHLSMIEEMFEFLPMIFDLTGYYYVLVPTYPSGTIGFAFCSKRYHPLRDVDRSRIARIGPLKYYNFHTHYSSFCLPAFAGERLPAFSGKYSYQMP